MQKTIIKFKDANVGDVLQSIRNPSLPTILVVLKNSWTISVITDKKLELIRDNFDLWERDVYLVSSGTDVSEYEWAKNII